MKMISGLVVLTIVLGGQVAGAAQPGTGNTEDVKAKVGLCVQRGVDLRKAGKIDMAQGMFLAALTVDEQNVQAMAELAWICNRKREYANAEKFARLAIQHDKTHCDALRELGVALWRQNHEVQAVAALLLAIDANPRDIPSYLYLESLLREQGLTQQADEIRARRDRTLNAPKLEL